jgi:hypothetical protein
MGHDWEIDNTEITEGTDSYNVTVNIVRADARQYRAQVYYRTFAYEKISRAHRQECCLPN